MRRRGSRRNTKRKVHVRSPRGGLCASSLPGSYLVIHGNVLSLFLPIAGGEMPKRSRLTNNSDETDIASLLSGDVVFSIPFFQRAYRWKPARLKQLNEDLLTLVDGASEFHFLGAVIIHGRSSNPSDPKVYEVIDGQQRITTLYLYMAATVRMLADLGEADEAAGIFFKYLVVPRNTNLHSNLKLHSCREDRAQLNWMMREVLKSQPLRDKLGSFSPKLLASYGPENGTLKNNYRSALRFLKSQSEQGGLDRVRDVYTALLESMSLVQIDVWDPTNGPKIFDSLNSRQEPMTIGDLVRNEVFAKVADEHPDDIEQIDQNSWQPFYTKFQVNGQNKFDSYFFPYGLVLNPNIKKSEVYNHLREEWREINDPAVIIEQLAIYQDAFIDLVTGGNAQKHHQSVAQSFKTLYLSGLPSSTLPFLMKLSRLTACGSVSEEDARESLELIESFLVRRATCGHEPTGLHAVFKRLWEDCGGKPTRQSLIAAIGKHKTVVWPDDEVFKEAVRTRPLYGASVTQFLLREYDRSLGGDLPENIPWIEHVLPESPKEWLDKFTKDEHRVMKDRLANLIPLSREMNQNLSNRSYAVKRPIFRSDSMFKSARRFAETYSDWTPEKVEERAAELAEWAVSRWRH